MSLVAWICGFLGFATPLLAWAILHGSKKLNGREPDAQDFDDAPLDPDLVVHLDNQAARFIPCQPVTRYFADEIDVTEPNENGMRPFDANDLACLRMLSGATFGSDASLVLPSGMRLEGAELQGALKWVASA